MGASAECDAVRRKPREASGPAVAGAPSGPRPDSEMSLRRLARRFWPQALLVSAAASLCLRGLVGREAAQSCLLPNLTDSEQLACRFFTIVFDGGSTGTRVHILAFRKEVVDGPLSLESETFREEKPGLSAFADDAPRAARSLAPLLRLAEDAVPPHLRPLTPLMLKATAGLRLISHTAADNIIAEVQKVFESSSFKHSAELVGILSGVDEGIFGWFTLNFYLNRLHAAALDKDEEALLPVSSQSAAALDLGGGSTQVTYRPLRDDVPSIGGVHSLRLHDSDLRLYTHSYLGNGLMAMRLGLFRRVRAQAGLRLTSPCFPDAFSGAWNYSAHSFSVSGSGAYSFEGCAADAVAYVRLQGVANVAALGRKELFLFGYFFDRASQLELVTSTAGGWTTLGALDAAVRKACTRTVFGKEHWRPWLCMDGAYIHALLADGYGLRPEKRLFFAKKFKGREVSWALGAGYHLLHTQHLA